MNACTSNALLRSETEVNPYNYTLRNVGRAHAPEAMPHTPQVCARCLVPGFEPSLRPFVMFARVAAQKVASLQSGLILVIDRA